MSNGITQRAFHKRMAGLAAMIALDSLARAPGKAEAAIGDPARLMLDRLTHGATPESLDQFRRLGLEAWLDEQLSLPADEPETEARIRGTKLLIEYDAGQTDDGRRWKALSEYRPMGVMFEDPADLLHLLDFEEPIAFEERQRPAQEVIAASLIRAVHARAQLREVITAFWHEHFSVNALKNELTAVFFPSHDQALRRHALGNFRTLLGAVARSPAMLAYLNNDESRASPANENYARELMELHTLGAENYLDDRYRRWQDVPGTREGLAEGYIEQDVYEVARAFTGWTIGDGREIDDGQHTPRTGRFAYAESWHDPYQKRVLGRELPANSAPMQDGEIVLDLLAFHPGTARFISRKMLRRLGIENPSPAYLQQVTETFMANGKAEDQIARVVRAIVLHPEFTATPRAKLRRPFEFVAALYRATGAETAPRNDNIYTEMARAGWTQHQVRPPTGHSDASRHWANTNVLSAMTRLALEAHDPWMEATAPILRRLPPGASRISDFTRHWQARFMQPDASAGRAVLDFFELDETAEIDFDQDAIEWLNQSLVAANALTPEFMFR